MSLPNSRFAPRTFATDPRRQVRFMRRIYTVLMVVVLLIGSGVMVSFLVRGFPDAGLMAMGVAALIAASVLAARVSLGRRASKVPNGIHVSPQHIAVDDHIFRWPDIRRVMVKGPGHNNHLYIQVDTQDGQTFRRPLGIDTISGAFREYDEFVSTLHGVGALYGGVVVLDHS